LRPDPANDPAPRRLRTEAANPPPAAEDYAPSRSSRRADKGVPIESERRSHRRDDRDEKAPPTRVKPNASISVHIASSSKTEEKPAGVLGFVKRFLGFSGKNAGEAPAPLHHGVADDEGGYEEPARRERPPEEGDRGGHKRRHHHHRGGRSGSQQSSGDGRGERPRQS
jgi:hypothetical protein